MSKKEQQQCDYQFINLPIDQHGIQYRVPKLNFNSKPFNGQKFDDQILKRAEMWRGNQQTDQSKSINDGILKNYFNDQCVQENTFTHFLSIPLSVGNQQVQRSFRGFRDTILSDKNLESSQLNQLTRHNFTYPSMLHLTILQLDLSTDIKMSLAKTMMKDLENEFQNLSICSQGDIEISFKGLKTNEYINPSKASALFLEVDDKCQKTQSFQNLKKIIHRLIEECLKKNIVCKAELSRSHIKFDNNSQHYVNRKLNVQIIQSQKQNKKFNATEIIQKYGDSNILQQKESQKGIKISQIHLSSKSEYEDSSGSRMKKELFGNIAQIEEDENSFHKMPYYACEAKIQLNVDDLFA